MKARTFIFIKPRSVASHAARALVPGVLQSTRAAHNCMKKEKQTATADRGLMRVAQNGNDK